MVNPDRSNSSKQPEFARFLQEEAAENAGVSPPRAAMQDMEKSLVERIADVDDERRRTDTQMRKALQAHRDDVEHRLARYGNGLKTLLTLLLLATAGLIWLTATSWSERTAVSKRLAEMQGRIDALSSAPHASPEPAIGTAKLDALSARIAAVSADVESLRRSVQERSTVREQRVAGAAADMVASKAAERPLDARQINDHRAGRTNQQEPGTEAATQAPGTQVAARTTAPEPRRQEPFPSVTGGAGKAETDGGSQEVEVKPPAQAPEQRAGVAATAGTERSREPSQGMPPRQPAKSGRITLERNRVALQLIGFRSREEAQAFIDSHRLPDQVYIREERFQERPWFAVIYSLRDSAQAVAEDRAALPPDLAALDIWVRDLPAGTTLDVIDSTKHR